MLEKISDSFFAASLYQFLSPRSSFFEGVIPNPRAQRAGEESALLQELVSERWDCVPVSRPAEQISRLASK
jgi:hypothetical protein